MESWAPPPLYLIKDGFPTHFFLHVASVAFAVFSEGLCALAARETGNMHSGFCIGEAQLRIWETFQIHGEGVGRH